MYTDYDNLRLFSATGSPVNESTIDPLYAKLAKLSVVVYPSYSLLFAKVR
jgi:hypothetical protein